MHIEAVLADADVAEARRVVHRTDDETVADQLEVVRIPAPTFQEAARGAWMRERFQDLGLADVGEDEVGNVLGRVPAADGPAPTGNDAPVLLAAHLDTVFPAGTDLSIRREGERVLVPGIADNARGLAAILAVGRAMLRARLTTRRPVVIVATVGEEGLGDLRGVKHLFREGSLWLSSAGFITLDGTGQRRIVHRAIGSRRLKLSVTGPGGHSWADSGSPNPIDALGIALAELARKGQRQRPRTTLNAGRIQGGTSVNSIPAQAWLELDLRSESRDALAQLEAEVRAAAEDAVRESNRRRRSETGALTLEIELIGERPAGETAPDSPIIAAATAATRLLGGPPELVASSTDANVPIALGIPAIAMGAGGDSGGTHTTGEWFSNRSGAMGIERALLTTLFLAGLEAVDEG